MIGRSTLRRHARRRRASALALVLTAATLIGACEGREHSESADWSAAIAATVTYHAAEGDPSHPLAEDPASSPDRPPSNPQGPSFRETFDRCESRTAFAGRETILLPADPGAPCLVLAVHTGLTLRPSPDGSYPDPRANGIVRDRAGRLFTPATSQTGPGFLVWDAEGRLIDVVGSKGEGPGEFPGYGALSLWVTRNDSIYAIDGPTLLVFGPELQYTRSVTNERFLGGSRGLQVLSDGGFLLVSRDDLGSRGDGVDRPLLRRLDREGRELGIFTGSARPPLASLPPPASVMGEAGSIWIGPDEGLPDGYVVEERRADGTLIRSIRRDVGWAFEQPDPALPRRLVPRVVTLKWSDRNHLFVVTEDAQPGGRRLDTRNPEIALPTDWTGFYQRSYEVIDPGTGAILAAGVANENELRQMSLIYNLLPNSSLSYLGVPDDMGFVSIEFYELFVVRRD